MVSAAHTCFDIGQVATMGFSDDRPGDGVGGWSDQGNENSFSEFDVTRTVFGGVPFRITDPTSNAGKAVVSFRHTWLPTGPYGGADRS